MNIRNEIKSALTSNNVSTRIEAVQSLGKSGDERSLKMLTQFYCNDPDESVRQEAHNEIKRALKSKNVNARIEAVQALGTSSDEKVLKILSQVYRNDPAESVRKQARIAGNAVNQRIQRKKDEEDFDDLEPIEPLDTPQSHVQSPRSGSKSRARAYQRVNIPSKFGALAVVATVYYVVAVLVGVGGAIGSANLFFLADTRYGVDTFTLASAFALLIGTIATVVTTLASVNVINLFIDLEHNTRINNAILEELIKTQIEMYEQLQKNDK